MRRIQLKRVMNMGRPASQEAGSPVKGVPRPGADWRDAKIISVIFLAWIGALLAASRAAVADQTESARLDWLPYSSSYLPFDRGYLTRYGGWGMDRSLDPLMSGPVDSRDSVGERFDLLRSRVLGDPNRLTPFLDNSMYVPSAPQWEGFCHQWAAGALDPQMARILEADHDVVCQGVFLSQGEIRELVTAFYTARGDEYAGTKGDEPLDPEVVLARSELGTDELPAYRFHEMLYDNLRKDRGVIASISPPPQVWNFPIYGTQSVSRDIDSRFLPQLKPLPAYLFLAAPGSGGGDAELLRAYQDVEKALYTYTIDPRPTPERQEFARRAYDDASRIGIYGAGYDQGESELRNLLSLRSGIYQALEGEVAAGRIAMDPDYQVRYVSTRIDFAYEAPYSSGEDIEKSEKLAYLLITRKGESKPQDSLWMTPPRLRPQFMWVPRSLSSDPSADPLRTNVYAHENGIDAEIAYLRTKPDGQQKIAALYSRELGLSELVDVLSHCPSTEDVIGFYRLLEEGAAANRIDPPLRRQILLAYRRVRGQANRVEIQRILRGVPSLTLADLDAADSGPAAGNEAELYSRVQENPSQPAAGSVAGSVDGSAGVDSILNNGIY